MSEPTILEIFSDYAVDEDWNRSDQKGVTAVPTFILNGMSLVGAQPYEKLVELMDTSGIKRRI